MDRPTVYYGQLPRDTDILSVGRAAMVGIAKLAEAVIGPTGAADGFPCTPTATPSLAVLLGAGSLYQVAQLEQSPWGSLGIDAHQIVKQGILLDASTQAISPPPVSGQSWNVLIQVQYGDVDDGNLVLPFYNAGNPMQPYSGPGNNGQAQSTLRRGAVSINLKYGAAATSGQQPTPTTDAGWLGLWVVTVANGATQIVSGNIAKAPNAPFLGVKLPNALPTVSAGRLIGVQRLIYSGYYIPSPGMTYCIVEQVGGGAAGGGAGGASGAGNVSLGAPGTAGCWAKAFFTAAQIGPAVPITVGSGGIPSTGNAGGNGGTTLFGTLLFTPGGVGGPILTNQVAPTTNGNGNTSAAASGTPGANITSQPGSVASRTDALSSSTGQGGPGGSNPLGTGGYGSSVNVPGAAGTGYGAGGAGCFVNASGGTIAGGAGTQGAIIITEYGV